MITLDNGEIEIDLRQSGQEAFKFAFEASIERYGCAIIRDHGLDLQQIKSAALALEGLALTRSQAMISVFDRFGMRDGTEALEQNDLAPPIYEFDYSVLRSLIRNSISGCDLAVLQALADAISGPWSAVSQRILSATAQFLWLVPDWFSDVCSRDHAILQVLLGNGKNYKPIKIVNPDIISMTLSTGTLNYTLNRRWDNETLSLRVPEGCLFITVGHMLQRMTNNIFESPREIITSHEGDVVYFSLPFAGDYEIRTIPECISWDGDLYEHPVKAGQYRKLKTKTTGT